MSASCWRRSMCGNICGTVIATTATATRNITPTTRIDCSRTVDAVVGCLSLRRVSHSSELRVEDAGRAADGSTGWPHSDPPGRRLTAALAVPREVAKELQSLAMAMLGYRTGLPRACLRRRVALKT